MAKFQFTAIDDDGKERRGMIEAPSRDLAATQVKGYGLTPSRLVKIDAGAAAKRSRQAAPSGISGGMKKPSYFGAAVDRKGITGFTRQLATLLQAGLPLLRSLEVLMDQEKNLPFKWLLNELADTIRSGNTFSEGLEKFDKEFDRLYVNMVRAGEASGMLDVSLKRLAMYMEKIQKMKSRLMAALAYPVIVSCMAVLIVGVLLVFVVPQFEKIFLEQLRGEPLPLLTQYVFAASKVLTDFWYMIPVVIFGGYLLLKGFISTKFGMLVVDHIKLYFPKLGDLFRKLYISRFARTLGALLESGVPVIEALNITRDTCGNSIIMELVERVRNRVKDGEAMSVTLKSSPIFPSMVTSMIEVGEETGEVPEMLTQVSEIFDDEVDNAVMGLTSIIEPLLIVGLAGIVVFILIALFQPLVSILQGFAG